MKETFVLENLVRADLKGLVPYDPHVVPGVVKLDANENPFDFPGEIKESICRGISPALFTRYPDPMAGALREGLSLYTGVPPESILVGNGSDEIILNIMLAFGTGREVLIASPTFSMYRIHAQVAGARWREIPRKDGFIPDFQALADAAARGNAGMIFICSPNNPTGNAVSPGIIRELLEDTGILVVVDEAYIEFGGESCLPLLSEYPNLIVLRTFSKAFGLAGLRVGYLLAGARVVEEILRIKQPYNLNAFSQLAAWAVLQHRDILEEQVRGIIRNREQLMNEMRRLPGLQVYPADANFILFRTPLTAGTVFAELLRRGVLIRDVSGPALENCLRVTVGTQEENNKFLEKLKNILAGR